jgi:DHA2 family multidrug resistance protein
MIVGYRGIGGTIGFCSTLVIGRWDPRIGMIIGFALLVVSGLWLMSLDLNVGVNVLLLNAVLQGVAVGVIWVPLTVMTFGAVEGRHLAEAMSLFHLLRNIGSSLFISLSVAEIVRATSMNYSRMTEMITPYNRTLALPDSMGAWNVETITGLATLAREIDRQAAMIGFLNAFGMFTAASASGILLVLLARRHHRAEPA